MNLMKPKTQRQVEIDERMEIVRAIAFDIEFSDAPDWCNDLRRRRAENLVSYAERVEMKSLDRAIKAIKKRAKGAV